MPGISAIIPNYNRETLVAETISNLLRQSEPPDEIIVVDDGSTDRSVEVIRSFGDKVILLTQSNQGPGAARNAGLRIARGEFIQFQDSDDLFSLNKLQAQREVMIQSHADIVFSPWVKVNFQKDGATLEDHVLQQQMPASALPLWRLWLRGWSTVFQSLLFRKSFLEKVGFYRTDLMIMEDSELFFRALTSAPRIAFCRNCLSLYRLHLLNKLTQDEGTPKSKRSVDIAHCLLLDALRCQDLGLATDFLTRSTLLLRMRAAVEDLSDVPNSDLSDSLNSIVKTQASSWLSILQLWLRIETKLRFIRMGSRWSPYYHAGPPTREQAQLFRELGYPLLQKL